MEGYLSSCTGSKCEVSCCSRGYGESLFEYNQSERKLRENNLSSVGVNIHSRPNERIWTDGCSDGKICKVLQLSPDRDIRALVCKIFPYKHCRMSGGGYTDNTIGIYLSNCPATMPGYSVSIVFTNEVKSIVKNHHLLYYNKIVNVVVVDAPQEA